MPGATSSPPSCSSHDIRYTTIGYVDDSACNNRMCKGFRARDCVHFCCATCCPGPCERHQKGGDPWEPHPLRLTDHLDEDAATEANNATAEPPASPQRGSTATATDA